MSFGKSEVERFPGIMGGGSGSVRSRSPEPTLTEDTVDASEVTATAGRSAQRRAPRGRTNLQFLPTPLRVRESSVTAGASLDRWGPSRTGSSLPLVQDGRVVRRDQRMTHDQPSPSAPRDLPETVRCFDFEAEGSILVMSIEEFELQCLRDRAHISDTAVPMPSNSPMAVVTSIVQIILERLVSASSKMYGRISGLIFGKHRNEPNEKEECELDSLQYPDGLNDFLYEVDNFPERIIPRRRCFWERSSSQMSSYDRFLLRRARFPSDANVLQRFLRVVRDEGQEFARALRWGIVNPAKYLLTEPTIRKTVAYFAAEQAAFVIFQES